MDPTLTYIVNELVSKKSCHTVILYGSYARGEETPASDYDVMGVKIDGEKFRDAQLWNGIYLDLFIYPEAELKEASETHLYMLGGRVLLEKNNFGTNFLKKLQDIFDLGPKALKPDEINVSRVWAKKALTRIRCGGLEGNYRRVELGPSLLEDYFKINKMWYRGPKESFKWLKQHNMTLYNAFAAAFAPQATFETMENLVEIWLQNTAEHCLIPC